MPSPAPCRVSLLTPVGRGAVATVLVDGGGAATAVSRFFRSGADRPLSDFPANRIVVGRWTTGDDGPGEEVVACRRTSGQIEIHCHGGRAAAALIVESLTQIGCCEVPWQDVVRNGEADPLAAEARILLARARTERAALVLLDQYHGALRREVEQIVDRLQSGQTDEAAERLDRLVQRADFGLHLVEPWRVVLAGAANVGKSSLINGLVGYRRAIVNPTPGTTRDAVTARTAVQGLPVEFVDTAGLREAPGQIERLGVQRARDQLAVADLIVAVFDASGPWTEQDDRLLDAMPGAVIVHNKCDLVGQKKGDGTHLPERPGGCFAQMSPVPFFPDRPPGVSTSAVTTQGLDRLLDVIATRLVPEMPSAGAAVPCTPEQAESLRQAAASVVAGNPAEALERLQSL